MVSKLMLPTTNNLLQTNTGWKHKVELKDGIKTMYDWYLKDINC